MDIGRIVREIDVLPVDEPVVVPDGEPFTPEGEPADVPDESPAEDPTAPLAPEREPAPV